jgi:protein involved in polysaccharide export with SLBB domain
MKRSTLTLWLVVVIAAAPQQAASQGAVAAAPAGADSSDALRPGDLIRLRVWREPDFTGDFPVDESGVVMLPRLGAINVSAERPESLKATLTREYQAFLTHTSVDVEFLRRVQIRGAVEKPGLYHVDAVMTVSDALALAGGVSPNGREDKVVIIRAGERLPGTVSGRLLISHTAVRSGDQLYVPERSWISRNPGLILGGISAVSAVLYLVVGSGR